MSRRPLHPSMFLPRLVCIISNLVARGPNEGNSSAIGETHTTIDLPCQNVIFDADLTDISGRSLGRIFQRNWISTVV